MRLGNRMIVMALAALGPVVFIESVLVFAAVEQTGVGRMAKTAAPADLCNAGRAGGVVAVASVARGRAEIATHEQRVSMHAGAIFGKLCRWKWRSISACESGHNFWIGVASAARLRYPLPVHHRLRIFRRTNTVHTVATDARWRAVIVFLEQRPAVRAILKLRELIGG